MKPTVPSGLATAALMSFACGGGPATGSNAIAPTDTCGAFDATIAEAKTLRSDGRLERTFLAAMGALRACPQRAHEARPLALDALTEVGRLHEARELAAEILRDASASEEERASARRVPGAPTQAEREAPLIDIADAEALLAKGAYDEALARADDVWSRQPWHARAALVAGYAAAARADAPGARRRFDRALVAFEERAHRKAALVQVLSDGKPVSAAMLLPTSESVTLIEQPLRKGDVAPARATGKILFAGSGLHIVDAAGTAEVFDERGSSIGRIPRFERFAVFGDWIVASDERSTVVFDRGLRERGRASRPLMPSSHLSADERGQRLLESTDSTVRVVELPSLKTTIEINDLISAQVFWRQGKLAAMTAAGEGRWPPQVMVDVYDLATSKRQARAEVHGYGISFSWVPSFGMDPEGNRLGWSTDETVVVDLRTNKRVALATNGELLGGDPYAQSSSPGFTKDDKHVCFEQFGRTQIVPAVSSPPGKTTHCYVVDGRAAVVHLALASGRARVAGSVGHMTRIFPEARSEDGKLVAVLDIDREAGLDEGNPYVGGHGHLAVFKLADGARIADIDVGTIEPTASLQVRFVGNDAVGVAVSDGGGTYRIATGERIGKRPRFSYEDEMEAAAPQVVMPRGSVEVGGARVLATSDDPGDSGFAHWDISTGTLVADGGEPHCRTWISPRGRAIALQTCDPRSMRRGKVQVRIEGEAASPPIEVSDELAIADSGRLAWRDGKLRVADRGPAGWVSRDIDVPIASAPRLSPNGSHALVELDGRFRLLSLDDGKVTMTVPNKLGQWVGFIDDRVFVANGQVQAVSGAIGAGPFPVAMTSRDDATVVELAGRSGIAERSLTLATPAVRDASVFAGSLLAVADEFRVVRVFSLKDGTQRRAFVSTGRASALLFEPDGTVERLGTAPGKRERLLCKIGEEIVPLEVCEDRLLSTAPPAPLDATIP